MAVRPAAEAAAEAAVERAARGWTTEPAERTGSVPPESGGQTRPAATVPVPAPAPVAATENPAAQRADQTAAPGTNLPRRQMSHHEIRKHLRAYSKQQAAPEPEPEPEPQPKLQPQPEPEPTPEPAPEPEPAATQPPPPSPLPSTRPPAAALSPVSAAISTALGTVPAAQPETLAESLARRRAARESPASTRRPALSTPRFDVSASSVPAAGPSAVVRARFRSVPRHLPTVRRS